ncbi:hypothetical protein D0T56_11415 [Dysgonomonas sp. 520]|nr:hypothetical protein [Dysgonomonas sp. 520]
MLMCSLVLISKAQIIDTDDVAVVDGKIIFTKEMKLPETLSQPAYPQIKEWGRKRYGTDFHSTIKFDQNNDEVRIHSRIELLLPENQAKKREKIQMKYKANIFIVQDKYVLEVTEIVYFVNEGRKLKRYKAEDLFLEGSVVGGHFSAEFKNNIRKSTTYFLNELCQSLTEYIK